MALPHCIHCRVMSEAGLLFQSDTISDIANTILFELFRSAFRLSKFLFMSLDPIISVSRHLKRAGLPSGYTISV